MAKPTNATSGFDVIGKREDLSDAIYDISPTKTPVMAMIGKGSASNSYHEWQTDALAAAVGTNKHVDGDDFSGEARTQPARIGNHCQIFRKDIVVTRRSDTINKAGRAKELGRQLTQCSKEIKRDIETSLTGNYASIASADTVAPQFGSLNPWLTTNDNRGTGGSAAGFSGTIVAAAVDGTVRALSETNILNVIQLAYTAGGDPDCMFMAPAVKQRFSNYMFSSSARIATPYKDEGKGKAGVTAIGAVDFYVSDFGLIAVYPDRFMRTRDVYILEKDMWSLNYLDSFKTEDIAKSGDSTKKMLLADLTLCSKNEGASGGVFDVDSSTAMVA